MFACFDKILLNTNGVLIVIFKLYNLILKWRHDNQHNDTWRNDTQ
jgi:hypothetical protein